MLGTHCMICHDPQHYNNKVNDARRIFRRLETIVNKYDDVDEYNDHNSRSLFEFDHQNQHFMCGHCYKVNLQELKNAEHNIDSMLLKICSLIKDETIDFENNDYHDALHLLAGYYPGKYRSLERFYHQNKKE